MNAAAAAQARHSAYRLFSRLYLEGPTAVLLPYIRQIPELAAALPVPYDADEAAAAHHTLFSFTLFPYESIFLGTDGLLGGPVTQRVTAVYDDAGFTVSSDVTSPDHIGVALAFMAYLCELEMQGSERGSQRTSPTSPISSRQSLLTRQHAFLQAHLLRWLPPLMQAIRAQTFPFYTVLAELTLDLATDHWQALAETDPPPAWTLPDAPDLLADEKTGLKQIAAFLVTPAYSGLYLGRDDVGRLARQQQVPRGFGGRAQMLTNMLKTAVAYDQLPATIDAIGQLADRWETNYQAITAAQPTLAPFTTPWQQRCHHTRRLLAEMKRKAIDA